MTRPNTDTNIALVVSSVRPDRFAPVVAAWAREQIDAHGGIDLDVIDLMDFDIPAGIDGSGDTEQLKARLEGADGFVVLVPEYNHGYPGYLKTAIDATGPAWARKPVALLSYGGSAGGARSAEQLRPVFSELESTTVRAQVVLTRVWEQFEDGKMTNSVGPENACKAMLEQLLWWANALSVARSAHTEK